LERYRDIEAQTHTIASNIENIIETIARLLIATHIFVKIDIVNTMIRVTNID